MKKYIYVFATGLRPELIIGCCSDLVKAAAVFKAMPRLDNSNDRLVYAEELETEAAAIERMNHVISLSSIEKEFMISAVNPDFIELLPGVNFDLK